MKAQRIFVYAQFQADAVRMVRAYGSAWTDQQEGSDGMAWWVNPSRVWESLAGLGCPFVLHWHCEPIPLEHREFLESRHAFVVPVHCAREGHHDQDQGASCR